ncbi:MAG: crossover junction endodeoxyribonuclease RuvC [Chloroflexota bacterium]|nr:crossover junction endodeoxyribonuclease RuvC [Chloroflexota bacterium]
MITLGVDPGTAILGFGLIDGNVDPLLVDYGVIETQSTLPMPQRLKIVYERFSELLIRFTPNVIAVEQLFFARNVTTAISVGQARGVILLAAAQAGITVFEYSPSAVKQAVVGYGKADKHQIQEMVRLILGLELPPEPDDAADALAIALCHAQTAQFLSRTGCD